MTASDTGCGHPGVRAAALNGTPGTATRPTPPPTARPRLRGHVRVGQDDHEHRCGQPGHRCWGLPTANASSVIPAITAARSTLCCAWPTTTIAAIATAWPRPGRADRPARHGHRQDRPDDETQVVPRDIDQADQAGRRKSAQPIRVRSSRRRRPRARVSVRFRPRHRFHGGRQPFLHMRGDLAWNDSALTVSGGPRALTIRPSTDPYRLPEHCRHDQPLPRIHLAPLLTAGDEQHLPTPFEGNALGVDRAQPRRRRDESG